jgi:hypothetical protein
LVVDDEAFVAQVLGPHRDRFDDFLERLGRHVEVAVKVSYDEEAVLRWLLGADPSLRARHERVAGLDPDAAYYERIRLGEHVAAALEERRDADAAAIYGALCAVADDVRPGEPLHPHMVVNGTFLVPRTEVEAFYESVVSSVEAHPELCVRFVGPLPPYSFSDFEPAV